MLPIRANALEDKILKEARQCTENTQQYEKVYNIPTYLLSAISVTETGRYYAPFKLKIPWPWSINNRGKSYFFDTKEEAILKVMELQEKGETNIDVGCMQINLGYHFKNFKNLDDIFDPENNVAYAAKYLRSNYSKSQDWDKATHHYHSQNPKYGVPYTLTVMNNWDKLSEKIFDMQKPKYLSLFNIDPDASTMKKYRRKMLFISNIKQSSPL